MKKRVIFILSCLLLSMGFITAQTTQITGIVVEENGEPVIGASVVVKGTTTGTITDVDGHFSLGVPTDRKTLVFSLVGMKSVEQQATPNMRVVMSEDSKMLEEVVVLAYGVATKTSLTGAATAINSDDLASASKEAVDKALVGKIAGVRVSSNTGDPGSAGEISVRGLGSINGSTRPLYVIDGIPIDAGTEAATTLKSSSLLSSFNPDEIESITVLKDAAAASLYGSRAANGVILITTKKGKIGKTKVSYSGQWGFTSMAVKQYEMADAATTIDYFREGYANYYQLAVPGVSREDAYLWADNRNKSVFADPSGATNTNWRDEIYKTGHSQDHQANIAGGNDKTKYFFALGYNNTDGYVKGSSFDRYSGRLNLDHAVNNYIDVSVRQSTSYTKQIGFRDQNDQTQGIGTSSPMGILFAMDPTATVYLKDGEVNRDAGWGKVSNPVLMLGNDEQWVKINTFRNLSNGELTVKFMPELIFKSSNAFDYINSKSQEYWSPLSVDGESVKGLGYKYDYTKHVLTTSNTLRYTNSFGLHNISLMAGLEATRAAVETSTLSAKNYSTEKLPELSVGQPDQVASAKYKSAMMSYLGQANYNYDEKYYLGTSIRTDGSSFLGKDNRWATFYSLSAAWRLTKEEFMPKSELLRDVKIRASLGTSGNLPDTYFSDRSLYSFTGSYGPSGATYWRQYGNPELGWEKTTSYNIGFDWNIYDRVNFTVEYYNKDTKDLLFQIPTSYITGFGNVLSNLGKINNKGIEFEISSRNIISKNFSWETNFNLTWQSNKVKELPFGEDVPYGDGEMYLFREGESMYSFYLPTWKGVDPETGLGQFLIDPNDESKGTTPYYSEAGKSVVGDPIPDVLGGISNTFRYRDFDLSFLITYQFGGKLFDYPGYFLNSDGVRIGAFNVLKDMEGNYWKNPGDVVDNPKPIYNNPYRSDRWSTRSILSTDNIRMREISFGYNVPVKKLGDMSKVVSSMRLFFNANNAFMIWSKVDNLEPDVPLNGYRQVDTPVGKSFAFGVNIEF